MAQVLIIAAHPDDEVLGCGGTIAKHVAMGDQVHTLFVADGETSRGMKAQPNRNFMAHAAAEVLGIRSMSFFDYRDQMLDTLPLLEITQRLEERIADIQPDIVYTHHAGDLNLDHRIVHQAAMTALRPLPRSSVSAIYAFEVLSSTEWGSGFVPNDFVDITNFMGKKHEALQCYASEMRDPPHPRSASVAHALAEVRGSACGVPFAEAFMLLRGIVR